MNTKQLTIAAITAILFAALVNVVSGQDEPENKLEYFNGGIHEFNFEFNSSLLTGIGSHHAAAGLGITTLRPSAASVYWNPAGLAFLERGSFLLEALPGIKPPQVDVQESIDDEVDAALEDMDTAGAPITYPDFSLNLGQKLSTVSAVACALPFKDYTLGFAYQSLFDMRLDMLGSGIEMQISTIEEDPDAVPVSIYTAIDLNMMLNIRADQISIAAARRFGKKFSAGFTLNRTSAFIEIVGKLSPEGIMTGPIVETAFNDPTAGYTNDFYQMVDGSLSGGSWGTKFGLAYHPHKRLSLNFAADFRPTLTLKGDMNIEKYIFPALKLDPDEDEETFDINEVNLAEATKTERVDYAPSDEMVINTPSSFAIGMAYRGFSMTLTSYSGELGYEYDLGEGADSTVTTYSRGIKPKFGALMGFQFGYFRFSVGGIVADEIVEGYKDEDGVPLEPTTDIPIPRLNFGFGIPLNQNLQLETLIFGLPESALKLTLLYSFD